ncbi:MAG: DUF4105 domain-containing protein [bacterium]|nr:DUF4105 domain-containing protein [bacterium]
MDSRNWYALAMKTFLKWLKRIFYFFLIVAAFIACVFIVVHFSTKASNDRDWNDDQAILPYAEINNNVVSIHNIRNFSYASTTSYTPSYYDKIFDLNKIKKVWYIVEPFSGIPGSAHTFLSFEFEGDQFVAISVEIRKEKGEAYHPIKGLFNQYELMYVIADEKDVVKLRSNYRKDLVYVYPVKTTKEKMQKLFLDMVKRANDLKDNPEFYNTITNTCTTNIVKHVDKITPNRVPLFNLRVLLPENSDKLAYELGLIDTALSFEESRVQYFINDRAIKYADAPDFSIKIRAGQP